MLGPILYEMSVAHSLRGSKSERNRERERKKERMCERTREKERETGSDRSIKLLRCSSAATATFAGHVRRF